MNKHQELKERIYKHCPELKELSFGCEVNYGNKKMIVDSYGLYEGSFITVYPRICITKEMQEFDKTFKILGHPIHLEHVIRAIIESIGYRTRLEALIETPPAVTRRKEGVFRSGQSIFKMLEQYDLTKSFDQNITDNPKLLDFLLSVIK